MVRGAKSIFGRGKGEAGEEPIVEAVATEQAASEGEAIASEEAYEPPYYAEESMEERYPRARSGWVIGIAFALLAAGWIALVALGLAAVVPVGGFSILRIAAWVGLGSGPLVLLALLWLLLQRTGSVEAGRYAAAASGLRTESLRLAELLSLLNRRIADAREDLSEQARSLSIAGDEATARLAQASASLQAEARNVSATAATLDDATASARTDLGVLLTDLPKAQARAAALGDNLRRLGEEAAHNVATLDVRLTAVEAQAKAADQGSAAAARRLAVELERLEGSATAADRRIAEAAERLEGSTATALEQAATGVELVRRVVDEQGTAVSTLLDHSHSGFRDIGEEATRLLAGRLDSLATRFDAIGGRLRAHESSSRSWITQLDTALAAMEERFTGLGNHGAEQTADLAETLAALSDHMGEIGRSLGQGHQSADDLLARIQTLRGQLTIGENQLVETLPGALAALNLHANEGMGIIARAVPQAEQLARDAEIASAKIVQAGQVMDRHGEATVAVTGQVQALMVLLARIDATFSNVAEGASTKLVDSLLRVRETAAAAADDARAAFGEIIPKIAGDLADATAQEMAVKMRGVGQAEIAAVGAASADANEVARAASEKLTRQLMVLAETTKALEARLDEHRAAVQAENEGDFARQIGLVIEALNSTAIDVGKLLSNEPTDTEWAAYLKGDRGVFTRRVVRLLDNGDARSIASRYAEDEGFRETVNRYVHDFEAMLRRILSSRDGGMMSVTLLSSDAGKLYVALAQAIERLRR